MSECFGPDFDYCGDCRVCNEPVDIDDSGFCVICKSVFHWGRCGDWGASGHICNDCKEEEAAE